MENVIPNAIKTKGIEYLLFFVKFIGIINKAQNSSG